MLKLAVVNTHPIQYYSPYYRCLAQQENIDLRVFYGWKGGKDKTYDPGFETDVAWDIPLLEGYDYTFLDNTASDPGTHHFWGIVVPELIPTLEEWKPDALLVFGWNFWAHLRALRHFHGRIPVLFRGDSTLLDERPGLRRWPRRLFLQWIYRYVDRALYVGQNNRAYFEAHGFDDENLTWVPHAIDNDRFACAPDSSRKADRWRMDLGISEEEQVVLFAGKLEEKKAPDVLFDAFLRLDSERVHLVMVGSGPMDDELIDQAQGHPRVHVLGFQNQSRMPVVYRLGNVFVLPSRGPGETWGLAVNEAMACGRPVVVTSRVGCAPDLVDASNGAVVPPDDSKALQRTLRDLLSDPEQLQAMGQRSAERIEDWSIEVAAERTAKAVQSVVG